MKLMILLAAGVSLDTWGIGVSYAVSGIKIPVSSKVVIGCINLCMTLMAVLWDNGWDGGSRYNGSTGLQEELL